MGHRTIGWPNASLVAKGGGGRVVFAVEVLGAAVLAVLPLTLSWPVVLEGVAVVVVLEDAVDPVAL